MIWDLFPALQQTDFDYMRVDNRRRLCHIPPDFATPKAWKDSKILGRSALYIRPKTKINEVVYPIIWNHCKDQIVFKNNDSSRFRNDLALLLLIHLETMLYNICTF